MKRETIAIKSYYDGLKVQATLTIPDIEHKGIVFIIYDCMENRSMYDQISTVLASYGYVVIIPDQRGHGLAIDEEHPYGYFADKNGWIVNLKDNSRFAQWIRKQYRHLPFFLFGHGMGSLIARSYLKRYEYEIDGLLLSGSCSYAKFLIIAEKMLFLEQKKKDGKQPSKWFYQTYYQSFNHKLKEKDEFAWMSQDVEVIDQFRLDPTCGHPLTIQGALDYCFGMKDVYINQDWHVLKRQLPVLFLVGKEDVIADYPKGIEFAMKKMQQIGYQKLQLYTYDQKRHILVQGTDAEFVYSDVIMWLNQRVEEIRMRD
ncbi:MAG: alpha/beta hydrolase [Erysipelotrichaceae bacterium]|nr:alpha/beta hydrolase [Erysipelotrichaceae bacterium]